MIIDLRSDTLTRPTPDMLAAMMQAKVGDDVFGEDPTVNELQEKAAKIFGMEAALYCASGTMTNQIGIRVNTLPQDEVICDKLSHIYLYEGGGMFANSHVSAKLLDGKRGIITPAQILDNINPDDVHFPVSKLVSLENTCNKGGGSYYTLAEIAEISAVCKANNLRLHLDGARVFNAFEETKEDPKEYGKYFDTISVCLSKGLGAPVGSLLLGKKETIYHARRVRKMFGGGMRQAGFLAAAGIYALENNITRLKKDHIRAKQIEQVLVNHVFIEEVIPVMTNIIIFKPNAKQKSQAQLMALLAEKGIKVAAFGKEYIRMVTHLDITDEMMSYLLDTLAKLGK